ncbi:MAG: NifB/NifX family molybdenum-iron cluster-binding protein [Deltaproteobacteria bacterium]|nr:NifB/NifX family molybdenum-iron cluster-binding protein [Deltaproteobacteria bacterium]
MPPDACSARIEALPRTAIPVFMGRVSPVLDTCTRLCILESGEKRGIARRTIPMQGNSLVGRAEEIKKHGVCVVICGAVSDPFYNLLKERRIDMVCGITGDIDEVVKAYRKGKLAQSRFRMPGAD